VKCPFKDEPALPNVCTKSHFVFLLKVVVQTDRRMAVGLFYFWSEMPY